MWRNCGAASVTAIVLGIMDRLPARKSLNAGSTNCHDDMR
jgi:hypothetical protein